MRSYLLLFLLPMFGCFDPPAPEQVLDTGNSETDFANDVPDIGGDGTTQDQDASVSYKTIQSIHAAYRATCALFEDKTVECWGSTTFGLQDVPQLDPVSYIATRYGTACAVEEDGDVVCWGYQSPEAPLLNVPERVVNPTKIAMGPSHACALVGEEAICWGRNDNGELNLPDQPWTDVAVGAETTCGISNEQVFCVGRTTNDVVPPVGSVVAIPGSATSIAVGRDFACAIVDGNTPTEDNVYCWGRSDESRIPGAALTTTSTPIAIQLPEPVATIGIARSTACAFLASGRAYCWGSNLYGQLGQNTSGSAPPEWINFEGGETLHPGWSSFCAMTTPGPACWGSNAYGETAPAFPFSTQSVIPVDLTTVETRGLHACSSSDDGYQCWGANHAGQIPDAMARIVNPTPQVVSATQIGVGQNTTCTFSATRTLCYGDDFGYPMPNNQGITRASIGWSHACGTTGEQPASAFCWGDNRRGAVSPTGAISASVIVGQYDRIEVSEFSTCALLNDELYCWGGNTYGELMSMGNDRRGPPPGPTYNDPVDDFCMGRRHGCLISNGEVRCWGDGSHGQRGTDQADPSPTRISLPESITAIACGNFHSCASNQTSTYCWGDNRFGQVSPDEPKDREPGVPFDTASTSIFTPVEVAVEPGQPVLGARHSCVVSEGGVQCWGDSSFNQFGIGIITSVTPEPIKMEEVRAVFPGR